MVKKSLLPICNTHTLQMISALDIEKYRITQLNIYTKHYYMLNVDQILKPSMNRTQLCSDERSEKAKGEPKITKFRQFYGWLARLKISCLEAKVLFGPRYG